MKSFALYRNALLITILTLSFTLYSCSQDKNTAATSVYSSENVTNTNNGLQNNSPSTSSRTNTSFDVVPENHLISSTTDTPKLSTAPDKVTTSPVPTPPEAAKTPLPDSVLKVKQLYVRGKTIALGESKSSILDKFGAPGRIVSTEYDFKYYVYNNNYKKFLMVAIKDNKVVGYYTDSLDFKFKGIQYGSDLSAVNKALDKSYSIAEVLTYKTDNYTLKVLMDKLETKKAVGIYVLSENVKKGEFTNSVKRSIELLVYDLTNSVRARNNVSILSWSSSAALSSRKHSMDMAKNHYFDHIDLDGSKPGDRMRAEGINYTSCGENIIAGYGTAILSNHGWFNSEGHRKNMLNSRYSFLGVGFTYDESSIYKNYITQNFYR